MSTQVAEQADQASSLVRDLASLQPSLQGHFERTRQEMIAKARSLISTLEAPMETILYMGMAEPARTAALRTAIDMGLFEKLAADGGKEKNSQQLADATKTDPALIGELMSFVSLRLYKLHLVSFEVRERQSLGDYWRQVLVKPAYTPQSPKLR